MEPERVVASATVLVLLVVTVLSGPLVGAIDLTPAPKESTPEAPIGSGAVDVTVHSIPTDGVALVRGQYGAESFYLRVPDAQIQVGSVTGQPMVVYKVRIPELGYTHGTTLFLSPEDTGNKSIALQQKALAPGRVTADEYDAELIVLVRAGGEERELARQPVTVEVRR
ncbi:hypothetical protein [Haladaptatus sp. YSMS36]|uniref:hypothetical protein n=1 Tax=Haladaptatus sp. YSMS36 TaxID=3033384 RepID=UPI0023E8C4F5|nr:hypothetical protein [Haladaptatus sp. YSMS36]